MPSTRSIATTFALLLAASAGATPLTPAELATLRETDPQTRHVTPSDAARQLAGRIGRDGNLDGIRAIIDAQAPSLLMIAGRAFNPPSRTLPEPLEALVVEHYRDPTTGPALLAFVASGLDKEGRFPRYRTRALFELLYADLASTRSDRYATAIKIVATELAGVERELVAVLPALDAAAANELVMFLGRRRYADAVPALRRLQETTSFARNANGLLGHVDQALLQIGTPDAIAAVLDRLRMLGSQGPDGPARFEVAGVLTFLTTMPPDARPDYPDLRAALPAELAPNVQYELVKLIAARRDARGLPELSLAVGQGNGEAVAALLALGTPHDWRAGKRNLEQGVTSGKLKPDRVAGLAKRLDAAIADPSGLRAELAEAERRQAFASARSRLDQQRAAATGLRASDPKRYASEIETSLVGAERLIDANAGRPEAIAYRRDVAAGYQRLASYTRFTLRDPKRAITYYERAAAAQQALPEPESRALTAWMGLADTLRFDLGDRRGSLAIYERMLRRTTEARPSVNDIEASVQRMLEQWLRAEIAFLAQGKRYAGTPDRDSLGPVAMLMLTGREHFIEDEPSLAAMAAALHAQAPSAEQKRQFARRLAALPASQASLIGALDFLPVLGTPEQIAAFLRKHDPAGYVTASMFAAWHLFEHEAIGDRRGEAPGMRVVTWTDGERALMRRAETAALGRRVVPDTRVDPNLASPESTWKTFVDALRKADLARAWTCTTPGIRNKFEAAFKAMTPAELRQMAESTVKFARSTEYGEFVEAVIVRANGNAGIVTFVRQGREWRIAEM